MGFRCAGFLATCANRPPRSPMPCIGPERPTDNCAGYGAYGDCRFERRDDHLRPADGILPPEEGGVGIPPSPSDSKEAADRRRGTPAESSIERSVRRGGMRAQVLLLLRIRKLQPWISELRWLAIARCQPCVAVGKVLSKRSMDFSLLDVSLLDLHGGRANARANGPMGYGPSPVPGASGLAEVRAVSYFMGRGRGSLIFL